ncbi:MAG: recombinase family protein [Myxococcota bacterium]
MLPTASASARTASASPESTIRRIQRLRDKGLSIRAIADELRAKRVAARGRRWYPTRVDRILQLDATA